MNKRLILAILLSGLFLSTVAFGADINKPETRKDQAGWDLATIKINRYTKQLIAYYNRVDTDGNIMNGGEVRSILIDRADDPSTPEDETLTEFSDFVASVPGLLNKINAAVKAHYNME